MKWILLTVLLVCFFSCSKELTKNCSTKAETFYFYDNEFDYFEIYLDDNSYFVFDGRNQRTLMTIIQDSTKHLELIRKLNTEFNKDRLRKILLDYLDKPFIKEFNFSRLNGLTYSYSYSSSKNYQLFQSEAYSRYDYFLKNYSDEWDGHPTKFKLDDVKVTREVIIDN